MTLTLTEKQKEWAHFFIVAWGFWLIAIGALFGFGISIAFAGHYSTNAMPNMMPGIAKFFLTAMNIMLAANFAMVMGVRPPALLNLHADPTIEQKVTAVIYVACVVWAACIWWRMDFTDDDSKVVASIPEIVRTGIVLLVAVVGGGLGINAYLPVKPVK